MDFAEKEGKIWARNIAVGTPRSACSCCAQGSIVTEVMEELGLTFNEHDGSNPPSIKEWEEMIKMQRDNLVGNMKQSTAWMLKKQKRFADLEVFCRVNGMELQSWVKIQ